MNFLQAQRRSVIAILDGLDDEALRRAIVPSGWTPLGIVEHLAYAERLWFQQVLTGQASPVPWSDAVDAFATEHPVDEVLAFYRSQCAISDEVLAVTALRATPLGGVPSHIAVGKEVHTTRDVILHMIEETARHAGHLDLARELIDGSTGLGPR